MITGAHVLIFSKDPEADRAFFRDVLKFPAVDAGEGWLIFALPPAEVAFHPANGESIRPRAGQDLAGAVLFLMCDDLSVFVRSLEAQGVRCGAISREAWGMKLPSGCQAEARLDSISRHIRQPSASLRSDSSPGRS